MKIRIKNLLSGKVYGRVARNHRLSKISPKVTKGFLGLSHRFSRVAIVALIIFYFGGYYPILSFPPVKSSKALAETNVQNDQIVTASFPQPVILPHVGYLSTRFSSWHPGVDIATGLGMPIHPITAGVVEQANYNLWGYGNNVVVTHPNGFKSMYAHMGKVFVSKDQTVTTETVLGEVGLTGFTSGPHTHLEVTYQGKAIDPLTILPSIPDMPASN
ncbi:hypothetical protein A3B45_02475 [Candidatus Daviesbacteria bacterium RIFCSPLOWO2_01_FULL_39_12]|uniref:M23ase beta-sheet core domain-containing protein n=1 Tax=Candidatus Daviesbacteria bacterium RIFCSPLOWO2_01_FULL_39_12 TaxID=1797785 RepID=A0A1F5KSH9_9BACT|nr:MAG: hypothetical protein A3B45_02475 [Candidatus Daviesbacteria bacterium RIFCSPLOWO2_01_FULL_39_12]